MSESRARKTLILLAVAGGSAALTALIAALLMNVSERKAEGRAPYTILTPVGEDDTDPAKWGINWPKQYDGYQRNARTTRTKYGGHGGSEALPAQKIERDPWLQRMFRGYAFSIDYRDRRGHAFMLVDQEETRRLEKPQTGSCLHCHAAVMPLYRSLGAGDVFKGLDATSRMTYAEASAALHEGGHAHPVSCVDCHDPASMRLRVTRPGFIRGIQALAGSDAPTPHLPSVEEWRRGSRSTPYDPDRDASRGEMRSFVCAQCHVEYYCSSKMPLTFPWSRGLRAEDLEAHWDATKFPDGSRFQDYQHAESGAEILKAQHPEFELWSQGVHARSGVSCADCHMPYKKVGAAKVSDHHVRSPLLAINRACQTCHRADEAELKSRVETIQERTYSVRNISMDALLELVGEIKAAKAAGATDADLATPRSHQRRGQFLLDFIEAENSMGFHAPQESMRVLALSLEEFRKGQVALRPPAVPK